ncbi:MAG: hypothetical protein ACD_28C00066G0001, partial [uncultured bacterium]
MNPAFWKNKRVLVTGHSGFKGGWLSLWLKLLGAKVVGFSLAPPTTPNLFEVAGVEEGITSIIGDLLDLPRLKKVVKDHEPQIVFHLAAQSLVRQGFFDPVGTYSTNVMGTVHLLEALRDVSVRAVVCITTDKVYENREWEWSYRENDPLGGSEPYANSKACVELIVSAFRASFFHSRDCGKRPKGIATARAGNAIGG